MRTLGQFCLLAAFVASGYAAYGCAVGGTRNRRWLRSAGLVAAGAGVCATSVVLVLLARALLTKDFTYAYVAQYANRLLPWHFSLAALWVGQAGSILLWAWMLGLLTLAGHFGSRLRATPMSPDAVRYVATGVLMACQCFLIAILVFAADPMEAALAPGVEGSGLNVSLHHPAMLIHPPVVFFGYALWTVPFAWAAAGLWCGVADGSWSRTARPWALAAWVVLGAGILLGAEWAYEELGWGGYWAWDPVENGSLIPWLTGTAFIHTLMAWRHCGVLKKTAAGLAFATFGLCNFATFLTRSGVFSSVHAFSESPIGWMFLGFLAVLAAGGAALVWWRRGQLAPERRATHLWTRESLVVWSAVLLVLFATVAAAATIVLPVSYFFFGRKISVGPGFYNAALVPTGLLLLAAVAAVPALRWERPPSPAQAKLLALAAGLGCLAAIPAWVMGVRHPVGLAVAALAVAAVAVLVGSVGLLRRRRREYAGFLVHLGFVCLAIGVTGSSLGTQRREATLDEGDATEWAGRTIRHRRLEQHTFADRLVAEAVLDVTSPGVRPFTLRPARHLHLLQNEWTTEVAIHATWSGDFYAILHAGEGEGRVVLTLIFNPLMRWIWVGGGLMALGALIALWPARHATAVRRPASTPLRQKRRSRDSALVRVR